MDNDRLLFDWLRYYAIVVALPIVIGCAAGATYIKLRPVQRESWSIILGTESTLPARQLGALALTLFNSQPVYRPAMEQLGIEVSPRRFLEEQVELRPVPDASALIVVGRASDPERAEQLSGTMARSLLQVFEERPLLTGFVLLDDPQPAAAVTGISAPVSIVLGGTIGFWLGIAFGVLHYRVRRPVLTLGRARTMSLPQRVTVVEGKPPRWLGLMRMNPRPRNTTRNRVALARLRPGAVMHPFPGLSSATSGGERAVDQPHDGASTEGPSRERAAQLQDESSAAVLVAHAGTSEMILDRRDTRAARSTGSGEGSALELVWVR